MELNFDTHGNEKQKECCRAWLDDSITDIYFGGAKGGAKSFTTCSLIFGDALTYPDTRYFIARKKLNDLRKFTVPTISKVFQNWGIKQTDYVKFNGSDNFYQCYNGSKVLFLEAAYMPSDPLYERFGSMEFTRGAIDEAGEFDLPAKNNLAASIGRWKNEEYGLMRKLLQTGNPSKNYTYRDYYIPYKTGKLKPHQKFIPAYIQDNHMIDKGYIEQLEQTLSKNEKERLLYGNWEYDSDPAALIDYNKILDIFTNTHVPHGKKYITADIARLGGDKIVIIEWDGWRGKVKHYTKQGLDITGAKIEEIRYRLQIGNSDVLVDEDGMGCLVEGTKVLTLNGWRNVEGIKTGEYVYSKDSQNNLISAKVKSNVKRELTDIIVDESGIVFSQTHTLPVKTRKEHNSKMRTWEEIFNKKTQYFDTDFNYEGEDFIFNVEPTIYEMPNGGLKRINNGLEIKGVHFAAFLGWYVSEGCIDDKYIKITQSKKSIYLDIIRGCLDNCGFNYYEKDNCNKTIDFTLSSKFLVKWLKENCYTNERYKSFNKKVPDIIKGATKEIISSFLYNFNCGDGHIHKKEMVYSTSSKQLSFDLHELIIKKGKGAIIHIKHKAGSTGIIGDRILTRKYDNYLISELKETGLTIRPKVKKVYHDHVYNLEIESETKLYIVMFPYKKPFFVHNGGIVDFLKFKGFVNNSSPLPAPNGPLDDNNNPIRENYDNLKSQCYFRMAERINRNELYLECDSEGVKQWIIEELEQVKQKALDSDLKKGVVSKDKVKELIGRSPDFSDSIMMREYFELKPKKMWAWA